MTAMRWLRLGALPLLLLLPAIFGSSSDLGVAAREAAPALPGDSAPSPAARPTAGDAAVARGSVPGPDLPVVGMAGLGPEALGRGAVRRTFAAPADGWYRLAARGPGGGWVVTVVDPDAGGVLASSRWEDDPAAGALVHARAGAALAVLVGALDGPGGAFDLEWRAASAPTRLRHVGRLVDGGPDARGAPVEIRGAGDLAFGAGRLYLASALGLSEFERDPASGGLALVRLVDADLAGARLAWDARRARLLAHDCGAWTTFERRADGGVGPPRALAAVDDPARCGRPLVDAAGDLVHRVGASGVDTFAVTRDGALRFEGSTPVSGLKGAALDAAGRLYVAAGDALWVIRARGDDAARFAAAPTGARLATSALARVPLAVDADGERLLAVDAVGARLFALEHASPDGPTAATELSAAAANGADGAACSFAALRPDAAVDLICAGGVVTARWSGGSRVFGGARRVGGAPDFGTPVGTAATPDGRHVYVSTRAHGILAFERLVADDHGDDAASATPVAIPSTTAGELGAGDKDYFRIDIVEAGILTFETTGSTDTYGTLYDGDGTVLGEDNDRGPRPNNFVISDALVFEGSYFLEVRGASPSRDTGAYDLRVTGDARGPGTPAATAPAVTIDAIPSGNEETAVRLGATLTGGAHDGAVEYAWSVSGGTLDDAGLAAPTWTRPTVTSNANHTVGLTVTVRGTGTNAESGTSDTASASREALVRDVPPPLPAAVAPSVSIDAIAAGDEGTTVRLGATLAGGTHDAVEHAWRVDAGRLANAHSATPTWTRPTVNADTDYTVRLTVTARGRGTAARRGSSARASASRAARVLDVAQLPAAAAPSVSIDAIAAGDEGTTVRLGATLTGGTHDGAVEYQWSVDGGALDNANAATPTWTRPSVVSTRNHTVSLRVTVRGGGTVARNGTSATANASRTALVRDWTAVLPVANPPTVRINDIPAGDEGTTVQLGAMTYGGNYDGAPTYEWVVSGGTLDSANYALPMWTRPAVTADTDVTVSATVTVRGAGRNARSGSSALRTATKQARVVDAGSEVRNVDDHGNDRASATTVGAPSTTAGTLTHGDRDWFRINITEAGSLRLEATGTTDTYGTLYRADGTRLARDDDDGERLNFLISMAAVGTGTYYLEVRGYRAYSTGPYSLEVSGTARGQATLPAALAPSVTINAVAAGNENTTVTLGAALAGGTYDGAPDYAWSVSGGTLDDRTLATPTWTRPAVSADANHTVSLTVTVGGTGTKASSGTSDTANATQTAQVRNVAVLPAASAPTVAIDTIAAGDENTAVRLGATLTGGTHDGTPDYAWSVSGGTLDDRTLATPTWTRPAVTSDTNHTVSLTVTVGGTGTKASSGTSDTANVTQTAQVRNVAVLPAASAPTVAIDTIAAGDENTAVRLGATLNGGTHDGAPDYAWSVSGGTLDDHTLATPTWTRPSVTSNTNHTIRLTVTAHGTGTVARNGTSDTANATRSAQVRDAAGGDHGDDRASATTVGIPSTTAGTLTRGDRDYFRIDISEAGSLRLQTTGTTDTWGTLYEGDGSKIDEDDDSGPGRNFLIFQGSVDVGTYHLEVRGWSLRSTTGDYSLSVSGDARSAGTQLPAASAPSVTIDSIAAGDEGTDVRLGATLTGGTHDGAPDYAWSVSGGTLDDETAATPTWTRPAVSADANHTVGLTVTVGGTGTNASDGSSDTANASRTALVRDVPAPLPEAVAPSVSINAIPAGDEGTDVQLGAAMTGGTHEGAMAYQWSVDGGVLDNPSAASPTWTRPSVTSNTDYTVRLGVTVYGRGTTVRGGTSATANTNRSAQVRNVAGLPVAAAPSATINTIPAGNEGATVQLGATLTGGGPYDGAVEYEWSVNGGTLNDPTLATPTWTRPSVASDANHTVSLTITVRGTGATARGGTSDTANASRTAQVRNNTGVLPTADAPTVTINAIPDGDEGATVRLGAALGGGAYDGTPEYAWSVTGGTLASPNSATPTWTRPRVASDTNHTVRLTVTVRGTGTAALDGTSDTRSTSRSTQVRDAGGTGDDHGNTRADASPVSIPSTTVAELGRGDRDYFRVEVAHAGSLRLQTRGHTDTVGTLRRGNGAAIASNDDGGQRQNFHIFRNSVGVGIYYLEVRGYSNAVRGDYTLEVTGTARGSGSLPSAAAPSVTIAAIADGDEGTDVRLGAALTGGTYDGAVEFAWAVDGGTLDDPALATPTWTRPAVASDTNHTASLIVTVHGTGTVAASGTSDTANASRTALVRNVATPLLAAAAPSVSIDSIAAGDEGTTATLGATLAGGTYDGAAEYAWSVNGGTLSDPNSTAPIWTRPSVASDTNHTVSLRVTVRGSGTAARSGTSATANATRTAQVRNVTAVPPLASAPSVSIDAIAAGDESTTETLGATLAGGTYDGAAEYAWSVNGGTISDPNSATPTWIRPSVASTGNYTVSLRVTVRGSGTAARSGSSATANATRTTQVRNVTTGLPGASAPSVSINAIAAGDEGTGVSLSATLTGGTYDGAVDYIWNVNGGTLANRLSATPTWSRPSVSTNTNYTVRLRVIVEGRGTTARSGTFAVVNTTRTAQVLDVASALPVASAPDAVIDYVPGGVGNTTVQLGVKLVGGTYDGPPEYAWDSDECVLDNATAAAPVCTRIPVPDNDPWNTWGAVTVTVTVHGTGTNARDGTIATDRGARQFRVRPIDDPTPWDDHANGSQDATLVTMPGTMAGSLETAGDIDWFYFRLTSAASVVVETTGSTDTQGSLHFFDRRPIADDGRGPGGNLRIVADLEPGYVLVEVSGQDRLRTGDYTLVLRPRPANSPPTLVDGSLPSAPPAVAGGAPRIFRLDEPFTDPDGDFVWLSLSSDDESVATATLQGKALIVHPHTAGTANITVTGHDPSGASGSGSFAVTVSAPTHADPTASFNAAGDELTLSFTDQFAPGETRAYKALVRQKSAAARWNGFCFTASNSGNSTQTQSVSTDLAVTGIAEPGTTYETIYRHLGSSCSDSSNGLWSRAAEATAPGTPSFDIELVFLGTPSAAHRSLVERAAARWERILTMGVPNRDFSDNPLSGDDCWTGAPLVDDVVDDVRVFVDITSIDGPGGTVGQAGACWIRGLSRIPIIGAIILDADDFQGSASGKEDVVLHELAHALGFSFSHWSRSNLLREPSIHPDGGQRYGTNDTHFAGPLAVAAFDAAGGTSYSGGKVPVSNNAAWAGSRNSHWRESVMDREIMTPTRERSGSHPLSAITIQAMADMGYQVDVSQADAYRLPSPGTSSVPAAPPRTTAPPLNRSGGQGQGQTDAATIGEACIVMDKAIAIDGDPGVVRVLPASAVRTTRVLLQ